jgi:hypothetical protein
MSQWTPLYPLQWHYFCLFMVRRRLTVRIPDEGEKLWFVQMNPCTL